MFKKPKFAYSQIKTKDAADQAYVDYISLLGDLEKIDNENREAISQLRVKAREEGAPLREKLSVIKQRLKSFAAKNTALQDDSKCIHLPSGKLRFLSVKSFKPGKNTLAKLEKLSDDKQKVCISVRKRVSRTGLRQLPDKDLKALDVTIKTAESFIIGDVKGVNQVLD